MRTKNQNTVIGKGLVNWSEIFKHQGGEGDQAFYEKGKRGCLQELISIYKNTGKLDAYGGVLLSCSKP